MGFFSKKEEVTKKDLTTVRSFVSFNILDVRHKIGGIFHWIHFFNNKHQEHDSRLEKLELHLAQLPSVEDQLDGMKDQIKQIVDEHYSQGEILDRLSAVERRLQYLSYTEKQQEYPHEEVKTKIHVLEKKKEAIKSSLRENMLKKIARNSKNYIKSTILAILRKYGRISAFRLKEMIVDEQALCSKSSFYRILEEIEKESDDFSVVREGKEKVFFMNNPDEKISLK